MVRFLINGIVIGAIYGLVTLGMVVVYKGSRVINFAHGETGMIGAFTALTLWFEHRWPYLAAAATGIVVAGAIGWMTDRFVVRRCENASRLTVMVATLAIAAILQFIAAEVWGLSPRFFPPPLTGKGLAFGDVVLTVPRLVIVIAAAILTGGLLLFFRRTHFGLSFRGAALDDYAAKLMGINVRRLSAITWTLGGVLSAVAALLIAPLVSFHVFFMTFLFIRALTAALVAGLTNLGGAFVAGILVGVAESMLVRSTSQVGVVEASLFGVILITLLVRPLGLFAAEY